MMTRPLPRTGSPVWLTRLAPTPRPAGMAYHRLEENKTWKVGMVKELIDMKQGHLLPPEGWSKEEYFLF